MGRRLMLPEYAAVAVFLIAGAMPGPALAAAQQRLSPTLAPLGFLVGKWDQGRGSRVLNVASSRGSFTFEPAAGGKALLRRDHNDFIMRAGHDPSYDQIMLIYSEGGRIRGDWTDGTHVIHYTAVAVVPGRSVRFEGGPREGGAKYRLSYELTSDGVDVRFEQQRAGARSFSAIAAGSAHRSKNN